ncbi:NADH-quinone oxidoreductase subunit N [Marininema halotolerans]|uniref:NADH-quinone oxidoreductase subunit N n=1 Tax=Marininema halotolerans TaxID=1155944 RepID=A0A1I6P1Y9_9BACL|nr:NADH-quinone oxidoreductase subunit N [Marininema halotolerans]SFS34222.1 NADH-quinone oxidoreductase subunit N [Marininema halotolerans]
MKTLIDFDWTVMAPELTIAGMAALLSVIDLFLHPNKDRRFFMWPTLIAIGTAIGFVATQWGKPAYQILADTYRVDDFAFVFKMILLIGTALVAVISYGAFRREKGFAEGEYYYLLLVALLGGMVMTSSGDLITLFVGLELLSIATYILVGMRKRAITSNEAAWKNVVLGGVASAFILYGMSFLYGLTGSTNLFTMKERLGEALTSGYDLYAWLALFLIVFGFGFKVAVAPFHMWVPDVYQGAPTPITAFLAVISKTAAFALMLRVFLTGFLPLFQGGGGTLVDEETGGRLLLTMAGLSMILGTVIALRQQDAKRLLAYSSIAQAGVILVPMATWGPFLFPSTVYYLVGYLFTTLGAFTVLMLIEGDAGDSKLSSFAGLSRRAPLTAGAMALFLLSLAGIPVTVGFFGKFYILMNAIVTGSPEHWAMYLIAGIMLMTTVASYFYYFGIIRMMYFRPPQRREGLRVPVGAMMVIGIAFIATLGLGLMPQWILGILGNLDWGAALSPVK